MTTIDILEECLDISYNLRKSAIKSRRHKPKSCVTDAVTFKRDDKVVVKGRYSAPKHYAEIVEVLPQKRYRLKWIQNNEIEILEASKLKPWLRDEKDYFEDEDEDTGPNINNMTSPNRKSPVIKKQLSSRKMTVEFTTLESQRDDLEAQKTFEDFKNELNLWWVENPLRRDDEDARAQVADDFTERYMCHKMDPLPASRVVTHIRKSMATIIEDFACDGTLPPEITGEVVVKSTKKPVTPYELMKAKQDAEDQVKNSYQQKREEARAKETAEDRENNERQKIKDQYENYMRLKSNSSTVANDDKQREKEIEGHLEDIKALISTFHQAD